MPSPFPGMDPYLESLAYWRDFHHTFVNYWSEAIADLLPTNYEASICERKVFEGEILDKFDTVRPDAVVLQDRVADGVGSRVAARPTNIPITLLDGFREIYVEIYQHPGRSLVAVLELLSPDSKGKSGRMQYLTKRQALLFQDVHLIELDLLRGGRRLPMAKPLPAGDCYYFLARAGQRPNCDVYTWTYKDRLPTLPIPLRAPDADVAVDLAKVLDTAYDRGRFGKRLRYDGGVPEQIHESENEWISAILKSQ